MLMHIYSGRPKRLSALVVVLLLGLRVLGSASARGEETVEIRTIAMREDGSESNIELSTSGRLDWRATNDDDGELQIRFANSTLSSELVRELVGDQLVSRIQIVADPENGVSVLQVQTRGTTVHTVQVFDEGLQITLLATGEFETRPTQAGDAMPTPAAINPVAALAEPPLTTPELSDQSSFTIGSGDLLEIDVLGVDELSRRVRVLSDGTITLPPLGNFSIAGLTVKQAEVKVAQLLSDRQLVNEPQVSIFVSVTVGGGVSVQGAVTKPGVYQLFGRNTLIEVVGQAGGLTRDAGGRILVLREASGGEQETIDVDVDRLVEEGDPAVNITLVPGDIIVVPRGRQLKVYVTGAVRRPGAVEFSSTEGITVLQAITAAGGPTERANLKKVTVRRRLQDGTEESIPLNVKKIQVGKEPDLPLERNDTVVVGEWLL